MNSGGQPIWGIVSNVEGLLFCSERKYIFINMKQTTQKMDWNTKVLFYHSVDSSNFAK